MLGVCATVVKPAAECLLWRVRSIHEMLLRNMDIYQLKITGIDLRPAEGPGHDANAQSARAEDRPIGEVQQMRAVAIKKGQSREKSAGFQEMGTLRCDGCGEEFVIGHQPAFVDKKIAETEDKQRGWRRCLRKNPSATRNTPTESNCRTGLHEPGPN